MLVAEPGLELRFQTHPTPLLDNHWQEGAGYEWVASPVWAEEEGIRSQVKQAVQLLETSYLGVRKAETPTICGSFTDFKSESLFRSQRKIERRAWGFRMTLKEPKGPKNIKGSYGLQWKVKLPSSSFDLGQGHSLLALLLCLFNGA